MKKKLKIRKIDVSNVPSSNQAQRQLLLEAQAGTIGCSHCTHGANGGLHCFNCVWIP